jgi:hypothetical protein
MAPWWILVGTRLPDDAGSGTPMQHEVLCRVEILYIF